MSGDVQETLNELERKLRELQAELRAPQGAAEPPPPPPPPPAPPPARSPLQDQLDELLRFRDQLADAANRLVEDYSRLLEQLERAAQMPAPADPATGHVTFPVPPPAPASTEGTLYVGDVVVEAGPFDEIGRLAAFEAALRAVP